MKKIKVILLILFIAVFANFNMINAAEELPDDGAKISSAQIIQTNTGTGPFDSDDNPGNDSSEDNNIIRSFDQVTWTIENTMVLKKSDSTGYCGGSIYFEATLPSVFTSETAGWNTDSMKWISDPVISDDGLTISGRYDMGTDNITIPGKQTLVFVADIFGAKNDTEFQPTIKLWLDGNTEVDYQTIIPDTIKVSATPNYNIRMVRTTSLNKRVLDLNYNDELIDGRIYGYAFTLQLYNPDSSKGLKGIEYPEGDITFDIDLLLERTDLGSTVKTDITNECTPILWNYKVNGGSAIISGRNMYFGNGTSNARWFAPYGTGSSDRNKTVYNSGKINMVQNGSKITVTISDYGFDGNFPIYNNEYISGNTPAYGKNVGCFSVGYFQVIVPDTEASTVADANYYLTLEDTNFNANSISGQNTQNQVITSDDKLATTHVIYSPGSFTHYIYFYYKDKESYLHSLWNAGDSYVTIGQSFRARSYIGLGTENDPDDYIRSVDRLFKFDAEAYEIDTSSTTPIKFSNALSTMSFKYWFVTKQDGTNWASQTEMNNGKTQDLVLYESLDDIPEGHLCVGIYFESQGGYIVPPTESATLYFSILLKVKDTAKVGNTYAATQYSKYWRDEIDRSVYSQLLVTDGYDSYPKSDYTSGYLNYIKTEYNEDGSIKSGTHSGGHFYGQTALIVGANQSISQVAITEAGLEKINYDLGRNENVVNFRIAPVLSSFSTSTPANIDNVTIKITDTLPKGLTYVYGSSNYGEPDVTLNSDGTTTLVWSISGCNVDETIEYLRFKAAINEETPNGTQYTNKVVISTDDERMGNTKLTNRTSTYSIQVTNLSSHRLYKVTDKPVVEVEEEIHFTTTYKNNTDNTIPDFQLLDILPYNGDSRGSSFNGTYLLDRIVITQEDADGNILSNDNLTVVYTNDSSVRSGVTSKDTDLGDGWTQITSNNIKQQATAIVVKGEIGEQVKVTIDVYLAPENNKGLDKYENSVTAQVYETTEEMVTPSVNVQVVQRKIEGVAWEDTNGNGIKDTDEQVFSNIEITLTDDQGNQVTDVNGNIVSSVKTDENGVYVFENLPKGNYYVKVSMPSSKYQLTEKEIGTNTEINSKFNIDAKETDEITKLNSIDSPEITASYVNAGLVKKPTKVIVNYKEDGTNTVLHDEVTIDGRIDDSYTTEDKIDTINENHGNKYEYVRVEGNTTGTMTEDTIYVTYYYQKKETNVKVLHVVEGTDVTNPESVTNTLYQTEEITGRVDDAYTTQNRLTEINASHKEQYDFVKVTDNATGNMTVDTIYVIYEYKTIPAVVKVNHLEKGTDTVLNDQETLNGLVGNDYTTVDRLTEINNKNGNKYELVAEPDNKNGTYTRDEQTVTYYYQKKMSSIEVNYLEVGTNAVLSDQVTKEGRIDDAYTTENKLDSINATYANKYEFVKVEGNAEGNYTLDKQVITYWYQKKESSIEVNYLEVGTNAILESQVTSTGRVDDPYTTQDKIDVINGKFANKYEFVKVDGNAEGNYTVDKQVITYWYQKKMSSIEVNYLEVGTNAVLSEQITSEGRIDDGYTTENKLDIINQNFANKYEFVKVDGNTEGQYTLEKQIITYWYQKKETDVIVKYVDINTYEEIYEQALIEGRVDDEYTTVNELDNINKNHSNKYEFVKDTENTSGNMTLDRIEVVYYYQKKMSSIEVNYLEVGTETVLSEQVTSEGRIDDSYTTENKLDEINETYANKYEFVKVDGNTEGQYTLDKQIITYWYQKKMSSVEVKYIEIGTNEVLSDMVTKTGRIDDEYTIENKLDSINENLGNKYEFVKVEGNTEGKFVLDKQVVTYYYQKKPTSVITKYVDINTNEEIYDQALIEGRVDDEYTTVNELDNINIKYENKYEFVKDTENTIGNMTVDQIEVVYYYQKKEAKVIVLHVEEGTDVTNPENVIDVLYNNEKIGGRVDDEYSTQNRLAEINATHTEQYDFIRVTENATGKLTLDVQYVIYEYKKAPAKIHIKHVDLVTGKELLEEETREDYVGISYTTSDRLENVNEAHENKYEVYSKPANKDGVYEREEQTIVYYYQKKETNVVVKYVDIDTEEELAKEEEIFGRVDEKYITKDKVEEINENYAPYKYVLVKTTENTEGNMASEIIEVVYYYQKVEAQVIVKHIDEKTGEEIADKDFLGGYVGEDYETSSKEIEGYELVEKKIPTNKEGQFAEETIEVIYYYSKIPEPVVIEPPATGDINLMLVFGVMAISVIGIVKKLKRI